MNIERLLSLARAGAMRPANPSATEDGLVVDRAATILVGWPEWGDNPVDHAVAFHIHGVLWSLFETHRQLFSDRDDLCHLSWMACRLFAEENAGAANKWDVDDFSVAINRFKQQLETLRALPSIWRCHSCAELRKMINAALEIREIEEAAVHILARCNSDDFSPSEIIAELRKSGLDLTRLKK